MVSAHRLETSDVQKLLQIATQVTAARHEPRRWRTLLLASLRDLLHADAGVALEILPNGDPHSGKIVGFLDHGLPVRDRRNAILRELNEPAIKDPFLVALLKRLSDSRHHTVTFARADLVREDDWKHSAFVARRRAAGLDESIGSLARIQSPTRVMGLVFLRSAGNAAPFGPRERTLLDLTHAELSWVYGEELKRHPDHAAALAPRLRETLTHLAAGLDERQTAHAMKLSPHTVHDYVKALYEHFGVSSRSTLVERWSTIKSTGKRRKVRP